jgi:hypothetical protein
MKFKGYFLTVLTIALLGSVFNTIAWYVDEQMLHEPWEGWNYDFEHYFFIYLISFVISFFLSLIVLLMIWVVESSRKKFTLLAHAVCPVGVFFFYLYARFSIDQYWYSLLFFIPGIIGYYLFVYRKMPEDAIQSELLDQN